MCLVLAMVQEESHFRELGGVCGMMSYLCNMCHNIMSIRNFNVIYATINITYCTL
jgi:hypothetical protein